MSTATAVKWAAFTLAIDSSTWKWFGDDFAWRYVQYDKPGEFTAAESDAREHHRGLWADAHPVPPWEFRRQKREGRQRPLK
jgi:hypothetical protein